MFLRKFIILNTQGSKDVKGHAKLEVRASKARLSLSVEGAETDKDAIYKLCVVSNEKNNFNKIELGRVEVDKKGRGKLDLGFNANDVVQSGLDIDNFNILILKRENHLEGQDEIVLGGYIHKDDDTLSKVKIEHKSKIEVKSKVESKAKPKDEINLEDIKSIKSTDDRDKIKAEKLEVKEEITQVTEEKIDIDYESHIEHYQDLEKPSQFSKQKENSDEHYSNQIASYTLDILKVFKEVKPFKIEFEDYKWWQIDCEEMNSHRGFLPYYSYILDSNNRNKHDHYLFGMIEKADEVTHYIYAIPGKYQRKDHPHGGKTGFVTWLEDKTGGGYWLSYIDARTGNVVRPS